MSTSTLQRAALAVVLAAGVLAGPATNTAAGDSVAAVGVRCVIPGGDPIAPVPERRPVDLVICLDTSGSMTALIDSARSRLWDIVNELSRAKPVPRLRVGLLTYGSPENSTADRGWIARQTDLTGDLDTVYAKMMGMSTSGGNEFVGWVLSDALRTLSWSSDPRALKIIFVAGNESADQAREVHDFRSVGQRARASGVLINAIYAGRREQGIAERWHEVASYGGGNFSAIDMAAGTIQIPTPHDDALLQLNIELNATYVPYGRRGSAAKTNQVRQDANAAALGVQAAASRAAAKGGALYRNAVWDLVDATEEGDFDLAALEPDHLPEKMRAMTPAERRSYIDGMRSARRAIQERIRTLSESRRLYLEAERRRHNGSAGLDDAMLRDLREQAERKGFAF